MESVMGKSGKLRSLVRELQTKYKDEAATKPLCRTVELFCQPTLRTLVGRPVSSPAHVAQVLRELESGDRKHRQAVRLVR